MKKWAILMCLGLLVICAGVALADEPAYDPLKDLMVGYDLTPGQLDGAEVSFNISNDYVNVLGVNRSNWYEDVNGQNMQNTNVDVKLRAFIPCYIEMTVTGNKGQTVVKSFGPNANAYRGPESNYWLLFDNEVGGFVDENWNSLGHGRNAEVEPGTGVYIQGCDVFKVTVYANDTYKYQVESAPLAPAGNVDIASINANDTLDLHMRSSINNEVWTAAHKFSDLGTLVLRDSVNACDSLTALHQFRVPYDRNTAHGAYTGLVTFRAATI